jgi:hypothetical protein
MMVNSALISYCNWKGNEGKTLPLLRAYCVLSASDLVLNVQEATFKYIQVASEATPKHGPAKCHDTSCPYYGIRALKAIIRFTIQEELQMRNE